MDQRQCAEDGDRPEPPNLFRQKQNGISTAIILAECGEDAHFLQRRVGNKPETLLDPGCLEREESKPAAGKNVLELVRRGDAKITFAII